MLSYKKYINPLVSRLDEISDFSKLVINGRLEQEEYPYL
jgi:hypothetical protein